MWIWVVIAAAIAFASEGCTQAPQERQAPNPHAKNSQREGEAAAHHPYYEGLIEEYQMVLASDPHNLAAIIGLANAFYDNHQWREASVHYERALAIEPHDADIRVDLGTCYRNMGLADRAIAEFRRVLSHNPGHLHARYNLGVVYASNKKDNKSAIREWEELLNMAPNYPHAPMIRKAIKRLKSGERLDQ